MSKSKINERLVKFFASINSDEKHSLFENSDTKAIGFLWETDSNGIYTKCEKQVSEVIGFTPDEVIGNPLVSFQLPFTEQVRFREILHNASFPLEIEVIFQTKDKINQKSRLTIFQKLDKNQNLSGYRGFCEQLLSKQQIQTAGLDSSSLKTEISSDESATSKKRSKKSRSEKSSVPTHEKKKLSTKKLVISDQDRENGKKEDTQKLSKREKSTQNLKPSLTSPLSEKKAESDSNHRGIPSSSRDINGVAFVGDHFEPSVSVWTAQAQTGFDENNLVSISSDQGTPAILAAPIKLQDEKSGLIEIIDDQTNRVWTTEDHQFIQEVTRQLGLALENTRLYSTIQRELSERVKAEREALRRNRDLTNLNVMSKELNKLVSKKELYETVSELLQEMMSSENILIAIHDKEKNLLSFPVCVVNSIKMNLSSRPLENGYQEKILDSREPLLINRNLNVSLAEKEIDHSTYLPLSLLAVPLIANDQSLGVISIFNYQNEDAFDQIQVEMLSSVASQIATSLQNIDLFSDVSDALGIIKKRQRIQSLITDVVARLGNNGSSELHYLLETLRQASDCESVFFAKTQLNENGEYCWYITATTEPHSSESETQRKDNIPLRVNDFSNWTNHLNKNGWFICSYDSASESEKQFFEFNKLCSILLLAVNCHENEPCCLLMLNSCRSNKEWDEELIDLLRVASGAFGNTLIRESLLEKLQKSLIETENLYAASHRVALSDNMQDMLGAIISSVSESSITRGEIILFDYDLYGKISRMIVIANYHNGEGSPPFEIGIEYPLSPFVPIFSCQFPIYVDDIQYWNAEDAIKDSLKNQNILSLALLPLWSGSVQIGILNLQTCHAYQFTNLEKRSYPPLIDQMATAIQNMRLFDSTQNALAETELLYKISSGITKSANMEELINLIGEQAMPRNCDSMFLYLVYRERTSETSEYDLAGSYALEGISTSISQRISTSAIPFIRFPSTDPTIIQDTSKIELSSTGQNFFNHSKLKSAYIIPLQTASNPVGFIIAGSHQLAKLDEKESHTLQIIGNNVAVAIERQRLLFEAQRRALELQTAAEIARDTTSTLSQDILLNRIVNLLKDRFGYYHCSIFLIDDENKYAVIKEATGEAGKLMKQNNHKLAVGSKSVIGTCLASRQPVVVNDTSLSPVFYPNPLLLETRSEMGIPLKIGGRIIGALDLQSKTTNSFSNNEIAVLNILSDQISVAIENARAYALSQQAVQEMRELDRVKSQFLANMSHELRTPLNSVIGFSRVILKGIDGPINKVQEQDITSIYNSGMNLLNMINEILDLSKIEAGKMELQLEEISLIDVIKKAVSTATGLIKDKPVELIEVIPDGLPTIKGDQIKLGQVVLNLLSNAIKFTEKGPIRIEAALSKVVNQNPEIKVTVTDSGVGIAPEDQPKLFQRFSQVDDSPTRKTGGTGLGLSISKSLIEMHGGKIGLESSEPGKGSTFFFTLPVSGLTKGLDASHLAHGENVILSIDDDPQVIELYERFLRNYGFEVVGLTSPSKALEKALELKPFAITLDIMMPEVDGWQVLSNLKQDERTRDIPILVCSIVEDEEKGFNLGASEYLVKPFLQGDLINAIHRINRDNSSVEVLIIDDDPDDLKFVKKMVEAEPSFHPTLAQGGNSALDILHNLTPDLIILDLFMPDMNGFELLEHFKSEPRLSKIPVIVLTGAELSPEQKNQLTESSKALSTHGLLKESDILKNMEEALNRIKSLQH